jgi:hypothetical protein
MDADLLMEEIGRVKENLKNLDAQDGKATAILRALRKLEEELLNIHGRVILRGEMP